MALDLYREISTGVYSICKEYEAVDDVLPIITTHDGTLGEVVETRLFVRNDDVAEYYTNISVVPVSTTSPSDIIGVATGHGVKLRVGATQPTEAEWEMIDYGEGILIEDIGEEGAGDISTYSPFWYRVECPAGATADNKDNIILRVTSTAHPVS